LGWHGGICTLEITLSNGESCTAGSTYKVIESHTFDTKKKITKVECIIHKNERWILRINFYSGRNTLKNFYSGQETLVQVGCTDDHVKMWGKRVESFEIAADEQLIGAELYYGDNDNDG
jgi:hypothetical protein